MNTSHSKNYKFNILFIIIAALVCARTATISYADFFTENPLLLASDYENVLVSKVYDMNTIVLDSGERISLIGIRSPKLNIKKKKRERNEFGFEIEEEVDPIISIEDRAYLFIQEMLLGQYVRLEFDKQKKDDKFDTFAYVFLEDGTMANEEILKQGFGHLQIRPPNLKYSKLLRDAYKEARQEKRGFQTD